MYLDSYEWEETKTVFNVFCVLRRSELRRERLMYRFMLGGTFLSLVITAIAISIAPPFGWLLGSTLAVLGCISTYLVWSVARDYRRHARQSAERDTVESLCAELEDLDNGCKEREVFLELISTILAGEKDGIPDAVHKAMQYPVLSKLTLVHKLNERML